jgi:hypothetical protein
VSGEHDEFALRRPHSESPRVRQGQGIHQRGTKIFFVSFSVSFSVYFGFGLLGSASAELSLKKGK